MTSSGIDNQASSPATRIVTPRLDLVPATATLVQAEMAAPHSLPRLLGARVPDDWPPEAMVEALPVFRAALERRPELAGWFSWYWVLKGRRVARAAAPDRSAGEVADRRKNGDGGGDGGLARAVQGIWGQRASYEDRRYGTGKVGGSGHPAVIPIIGAGWMGGSV